LLASQINIFAKKDNMVCSLPPIRTYELMILSCSPLRMVTGQGRERHNVNCFKTGGAVLYSTLGVSTVSFTEAKSAVAPF